MKIHHIGYLVKNVGYHICYETDSFDETVKNCLRVGYIQIKEPEQAPCLDDRKVCFLIGRDVGMIEILEK